MPVPDYETLMLPVLRLFASGAKNVSDCLPQIKQQFHITDEEAQKLIPSGRVTLLANRTHWARTYLSKAGLLTSPRRNEHVITDLGRRVLAQNPARIDNEVLKQFDSFTEWLDQSHAASGEKSIRRSAPAERSIEESSATPEDAMETASALLNAALRDELLSFLQQVSPTRFERLILDLLNAMGYGGGQIDSAALTKSTGDGGIDGIISEDALGLDAVYIQAKRYAPENTVGRPHIQQFIGSLTGESATKGVFVTTSDFSREARDYLNKVQQRVVLINGQKLAQLMIQHGVGVRTRTTYAVRSVDDDYFSEVTDS
ncbi:MAG TPA: restriction endonuclease [Sphingomicrobium sp.]|nr:restriction endonuclease [Sphingomicrobium sp.]